MNIFIRILGIMGLILLLLPLSGCLDIEQNLWIYDDGRARMQTRIGLYQQYILLNGGEADEQICARFFAPSEQLQQLPNVVAVAQRFNIESGVAYCEQTVESTEFAALENIQSMALRGSEIKKVKNDYQTEFTLRSASNGEGIFRQHLRNTSGDSNKPILESQVDRLANSIIGPMLSGRYWTVTLHAYKIRETNGQLDEANSTVKWRVPLYDLVQNQDYTFDMQAKFDAQAPWYRRLWNWIRE